MTFVIEFIRLWDDATLPELESLKNNRDPPSPVALNDAAAGAIVPRGESRPAEGAEGSDRITNKQVSREKSNPSPTMSSPMVMISLLVPRRKS